MHFGAEVAHLCTVLWVNISVARNQKKVEETAGTRAELSHDFPISGGKKINSAFK